MKHKDLKNLTPAIHEHAVPFSSSCSTGVLWWKQKEATQQQFFLQSFYALLWTEKSFAGTWASVFGAWSSCFYNLETFIDMFYWYFIDL